MPTYEQLYHLKLGNLKSAADRWVETSTKFKGLHTSFGERVERPYKDAGWRQPVMTAAYAGTKTTEAKQEFEDAGIEANSVAKVLSDLHTKLAAYQTELRECADVQAKNKGLHVSAKGEVTARHDLSQDNGARHDPDGQDLIRQQQADIDVIVAKLERILQKATDADEEACYALNKNLGGDNANFNDSVYTSLNDADAARDSARALELARKGKDMTDQELTELNALLEEHRNDTTITPDGKGVSKRSRTPASPSCSPPASVPRARWPSGPRWPTRPTTTTAAPMSARSSSRTSRISSAPPSATRPSPTAKPWRTGSTT